MRFLEIPNRKACFDFLNDVFNLVGNFRNLFGRKFFTHKLIRM